MGKRIPAKSVLNAPLIYGGLFASMAYGAYQYKRGMRQVFKNEVEMKSASLAITPLMLAERDREFLKQLRRNRDAEEKLMKDVEGWEVGTWFGHKVYKTIGDGPEAIQVGHQEYMIHTNRDEMRHANNLSNWLRFD